MLSDFNKIFNNPLPQANQKIPESYAKYLSQSLPKELHYLPSEGGACVMISDNEKITIGGLCFDPNEEQKKDLGKTCSFYDVLNYIDNSQQPMKLTPVKPGFIKINGEDIRIEDVVVYPFLDIDTSGSSYMILPHKFTPPTALIISGQDYEYSINVSRVANNSTNILMYESEQTGKPISIQIRKDINSDDVELCVNCNPQEAKTVKELAICVSIYNDFIDGKGKIDGINVPKDEQSKPFDTEFVSFWVKVMKIANELGVDFIPTDENISRSKFCCVEQVYQNLVNKNPVRDCEKVINSIVMKEFSENEIVLDDLIGKSMEFYFETDEEFDFWGNRFKLHQLIGISDVIVERVAENENGGKTLFFKDKSPAEKKYVSVLGFRNQDELDDFKRNNSTNLMEILSSAKPITEYI